MSTYRDNTSNNPAPPARGLPINLIAKALQAFFKAFGYMSMYPTGHPSVQRAVNHTVSAFNHALAERQTLTITVARDHLICDDQKIDESATGLSDLAALLHKMDVIAAEFHCDLTIDDLVNFLQTLTQAHTLNLTGAKLLELIDEQSIDTIRLYTIESRKLYFADGANQFRDNETSPEESWIKIAKMLTHPAVSLVGDTFQNLANEITAKLRSDSGEGLHLLRDQIQQVVQSMNSRPADECDMVRARLAEFVASLNDDLRHDLLQVHSDQSASSLNLISELADELPVGDLVEALRNVDHQQGQVPQEMLRLVKKLIGICHIQPINTSQVHNILQKWGLSPQTIDQDITDSQDMLSELFQRPSQNNYNPEDYKLLLDTSPQANPATGTLVSKTRYGDPLNHDEVCCHSARIASQILSSLDGDKYRPGLFAYVDSATELLLAQGNIKTLHTAVTAAQTHCRLDTNADETRLAAQGFLQNFKDPNRLDAIIDCTCRQVQLLPEALDLLHQAGPLALTQVVNIRAMKGWSALKPVFTILRQLPNDDAVPVLKHLLDHEQIEVRHETLKTLWKMDQCPDSSERYLRQAMIDQNSRVEFDAIRRLAQQNTNQSFDLLCAYIEGKLSDRMPSLYHYRQAVIGLIDRGETGLNHLCNVLKSFCNNPRKAKWAKIIAENLNSKIDSDAVRKSLKSWRFSPARLSLVLQNSLRKFLGKSKHD